MNNLAFFLLLSAGVVYFASSTTTLAQTTKPTTQPSAVYSCPMHPEVVSDKPGKCPKCGMNLVLKK